MVPIRKAFLDLHQLTQRPPKNGDTLCLKIQDLCSTILSDKSGQDKTQVADYIPPLKERVSALEEAGVFANPISGQAAKQALEKVILKYDDPLELMLEQFKKDALEDTEEFEKGLIETTLHPALLKKILYFLAQEKPAYFVRLFPHLKLSENQKKQIIQFLEQNQPFLLELLTKSLTQSEAIDLYLDHFPADSCWSMDDEFLSLFRKPLEWTPERAKEYYSRFEKGLCQAIAIQHLSGQNYKESHARFLQNAYLVNFLKRNRSFAIELGKEIMTRPDTGQLFERMEKILDRPLEDVPPDDAVCYYVGAAAQHFYMDSEDNQVKYPEETYLCATLINEIDCPLNNILSIPLLEKEGLRKVKEIVENKPLSKFLLYTKVISDGDYCMILSNREGSKAHALSFSLDDLTFCDANDFDPETFEPHVYIFETQEDLLFYINAHMAIFYKPLGYKLFTLTQFSRILSSH